MIFNSPVKCVFFYNNGVANIVRDVAIDKPI